MQQAHGYIGHSCNRIFVSLLFILLIHIFTPKFSNKYNDAESKFMIWNEIEKFHFKGDMKCIAYVYIGLSVNIKKWYASVLAG